MTSRVQEVHPIKSEYRLPKCPSARDHLPLVWQVEKSPIKVQHRSRKLLQYGQKRLQNWTRWQAAHLHPEYTLAILCTKFDKL
jgi:hypothetical protein